ncbi:MAG: preprotein translocase subunit SecG [Bacteroidota bacterium]
MTILFIALIVLASVVLGLIVLVQNPKGGGLAGNIAGFSNQFMGVKQTTDVLEKGTWIFAGVIGVMCILSVLFISGSKSSGSANKAAGAPVPASSQPATTQPGTLTLPGTTPATKPK